MVNWLIQLCSNNRYDRRDWGHNIKVRSYWKIADAYGNLLICSDSQCAFTQADVVIVCWSVEFTRCKDSEEFAKRIGDYAKPYKLEWIRRKLGIIHCGENTTKNGLINIHQITAVVYRSTDTCFCKFCCDEKTVESQKHR
jgi:hypothetical protein